MNLELVDVNARRGGAKEKKNSWKEGEEAELVRPSVTCHTTKVPWGLRGWRRFHCALVRRLDSQVATSCTERISYLLHCQP